MDAAISFEIDGKTVTLKIDDFTGEDDLALFQKTGVTLFEVFGGKITLFTVAGLLWLHRRKIDPKLLFEQVAKTVNFSTIETIDSTMDTSEGEVNPPA